MRVTQVLYSGLGGHAAVAFGLARPTARRHGWRNGMVFVGIEPLAKAHADAASLADVVHEHVRTIPGHPWLAWPRLYRSIARQRPQAILLHSVKTVVPCAVYAWLHRIPLVAVEHQANALKRPVEWRVSGLAMRLADHVVVLTDAYREQLQLRLGNRWRDRKVSVIPNGIDTREFSPAPHDARAEPCVVGMAARITGIKRQDVLVDAIAQLRERDGRSAWRMTLCGDGDGMTILARKRDALGLQDVVELPGHLAPTELRAWFGKLDIYAHASEGETLSTSLLQAMAMGLPIVGSDVDGIGALLATDGGVGLAVAQLPEAFAAALTRIRDDAVLRRDLATRARKLAEAAFSEDAMADRYASLLESLCAP